MDTLKFYFQQYPQFLHISSKLLLNSYNLKNPFLFFYHFFLLLPRPISSLPICKSPLLLDQVYKRYKEIGLIRVIQDLSKTPNPNLYILRDSNNKFIAGNFSDTDSLWNLKRLDNRVVLFSYDKKNNKHDWKRRESRPRPVLERGKDAWKANHLILDKSTNSQYYLSSLLEGLSPVTSKASQLHFLKYLKILLPRFSIKKKLIYFKQWNL